MKVRLQKVIADAGIASRRKAEELILQGEVRVNGQVVDQLGMKVDPEEDAIKVGNRMLRSKTPHLEYWALYKPKSCITSLEDPQGRDCIVKYFPHTPARLFPVGRLDYDAEGLVLLTNDGDLAHKIQHPSQHVWKTYFVKIRGKLSDAEVKALCKGPVLDHVRRQPVKLKLIHAKEGKSWWEVGLQEGIKHHIKKMFGNLGYRVEKIKRYSIGNVELQDMKSGESRRLSPEEVQELIRLAGGQEA